MGSGIYFPLSAILFSILILLLFFLKGHIKTAETKIYGLLIITNFIGLLVELACTFAAIIYEQYPIFSQFILKLYLVCLITWAFIFTIYIYYISHDREYMIKIKKKGTILSSIFYYITILGIFILPINLVVENNFETRYTQGLSVYFTYFISFILTLIMLYCMLKNYKKLKTKKFLPLFAFLFLGSLSMIFQMFNPSILLITYIETFITSLMYHTIENPDVKMIDSLNLAKDTAEKANRAKSDFLSSMSHEIRTPLNAIVGFSECIANADSLEEAKDNANDVITASNTLLEIVNGILDISKIEAGKLELVNTDYDTNKLFNDIVKLIKARIGEKPLDFKVSIAEDIPKVLYGDHINVKKIMINLLTNAVKYTDQGWISLNVKCVKTNEICRLIVSVKDTGRGIKKEDINKLFTKFQRVDEDRNTTIEGTGLGLAITKQLVQMMNGNIVVNSVYGEGSEFTVAIDQRLSLAKLEQEKEESVNTDLDLTGKKILIVDDNKLNIKVAEKILAKYNPTIDSCESGFECLEKVKVNNYDLILLDDMMPKMRGGEVLVKLKENPNFNTPVIVLTANAINGMEEQYLSKGFNGYLAKPIEKDKLFYILNKYLGNSKNNISNNSENVFKETITNNNVNVNKGNINYLKEKGVNIDSALELLGDVSTYNEILREYVNGVNEKVTNLTNFKNNNDMENYAILVHSLKSESRYLGFDKLADICLQHELKSKENDATYVNNNFNILLTELNNILEIVKQYLN